MSSIDPTFFKCKWWTPNDHLSNFATYFTIQSSCSYISMIWQWQFSITTSDGLLLDLTVYHCLSLHQQWMLVDKWWPKFRMSIQFQQHCGHGGAGQLSCVAASGPRACHNIANGRSGKTQAVIANWSHTWPSFSVTVSEEILTTKHDFDFRYIVPLCW